MHRRGLLAAIAASTSVAVAGCAGQDGESFELDAEPARIPDDVAADAGYEGTEPESFTLDQEFDVVGVNARVSATTWTAGYENPDNGSALFVASTPDESVAGQSINPLVRADDVELIRRLFEQVDQRGVGGGDTDIRTEDIEPRGSETRTVLGEEVEISVFETTINAQVDSGDGRAETTEDVPVLFYVGTVQHRTEASEDVIVLIGVHPVAVDAGDALLSLMEEVEH